MTDFPPGLVGPTPTHISTYSDECGLPDARGTAGPGSAANLTWVANRAIYVPLSLPYPYPIKRFFWTHGNPVGGSTDVGIFSFDFAKIVSTGSIADAGSNAVLQYSALASVFLLTPGRYWLALSHNSAAAAHLRGGSSLTVASARRLGLLEELSAFPLPASATPVTMTSALFPLFGITRTASGF